MKIITRSSFLIFFVALSCQAQLDKVNNIITSFENLYYQVKDDGVYFVEDLHTAYWPQYEGVLKLETTFIEYAKNKIDQLNGNWFENGFNDFTKLTQSICAYDSIVVFEKRVQGYRMDIKTAGLKYLKY